MRPRTTWAVQVRDEHGRWTTDGHGLRLSQAHRRWRTLTREGLEARLLLNGRAVPMRTNSEQLDLYGETD